MSNGNNSAWKSPKSPPNTNCAIGVPPTPRKRRQNASIDHVSNFQIDGFFLLFFCLFFFLTIKIINLKIIHQQKEAAKTLRLTQEMEAEAALRRNMGSRELIRSKDLETGKIYAITSLRLVQTQFGSKIVGILDGVFDYYLPNRMQEIMQPLCTKDLSLCNPVRFRFLGMKTSGTTSFPTFEVLPIDSDLENLESCEQAIDEISESQIIHF